MKIGILQLNTVVGDIKGNSARIIEAAKRAVDGGADWCMTSELALLGYPPRDLLLYPDFVAQAQEAVLTVASALEHVAPILLGAVEANLSGQGKGAYNSAFWCMEGEILRTFRKTLLPNHDVFDESCYFEAGYRNFAERRPRNVISYMGSRIGVTICEDAWNDKRFWPVRKYHDDPVEALCREGVDIIVNLSASPFSLNKQAFRERMFGAAARQYRVPFVCSNQCGGNDELVFDGCSFAVGTDGQVFARAKGFEEDVLVVETGQQSDPLAPCNTSEQAQTHGALTTGLRDYVRKSGFQKVVIGLSGGIDSAVTAALAVHALGAENVLGVLMPSPWSSDGSVADALALAGLLGMETHTLPIEPVMLAMEETLKVPFAGQEKDVTEENIQARIRGNLLMALANKLGALVLVTGNKSELAVGYCTIYGDMAGALGVISDVPKTAVYELALWMNEQFGATIPEPCLTKPPSAELRPGQKDQDSLPDYKVLDGILELHVEQCKGREDIRAKGYDGADVDLVLDLVKRAEFKRKQAAPGLKIRERSFGAGWRMVLASAFRL